MKKQINECDKTLNGIRSKTSSSVGSFFNFTEIFILINLIFFKFNQIFFMKISKFKFHLIIFLIAIFFNPKNVKSASFTFPSSLTTNTSDFVLLSETGTTPSVSGFSTDVLITIRATAGYVKITTVTGLEQINGYCGYTADSSSEPKLYR